MERETRIRDVRLSLTAQEHKVLFHQENLSSNRKQRQFSTPHTCEQQASQLKPDMTMERATTNFKRSQIQYMGSMTHTLRQQSDEALAGKTCCKI